MKKSAKTDRATLGEIQLFCVCLGLEKSDGDYIYWHWEGNGWKRAGQPIKNWQACIRAWQLARYFPSQRVQFRPSNLPSPAEVRRVIREHKDRVIGCHDKDALWDRIFRTELHCSYQDAMKVLE